MSFSAAWQDGVSKENAAGDLALEKGMLSPPLENMTEEVRCAVAAAASAATSLIHALPDPPAGNSYKVSAYGHVSSGAGDLTTTNIAIAEFVVPVEEETPAPEAAAEPAEGDEATPGSDAAIADDQFGPLT